MTVTSNRTPNQQEALDTIRHRKQGYQHTFKDDNKFARIVLADLSRFCRANKSTFNSDPRIDALLQGRREVWLRIAEHLNMSEAELFERFVNGVK